VFLIFRPDNVCLFMLLGCMFRYECVCRSVCPSAVLANKRVHYNVKVFFFFAIGVIVASLPCSQFHAISSGCLTPWAVRIWVIRDLPRLSEEAKSFLVYWSISCQ